MKFLKTILVVLIGLLLGIGIGVYRIAQVDDNPLFFKNGTWQGCKDLPLGKDYLLTAQVSVFALFALPGTEAIYLFSIRDNKNERLTGEKDYVINGNIHDINARYWSITAYGKDLYLIPNAEERFSFNYNNLKTDSAGNYTITISRNKKDGNWLPAPGGKFNLVLRIYKGDEGYLSNLEKAKLPQLKVWQK